MANYRGVKWNKGGALKRRKLGRIDYRQFEELAEELQNLNADLKTVFSEVMEEEARKIQDATTKAMASGFLPAGGKYSTGNTKDAIKQDPKSKWSGSVGSIAFGFEYDKPNAGKWLITGTPKMQPNAALARIYASDKYKSDMTKSIKKALEARIAQLAGG